MFPQVPGPATAGPRGGAGRGCGHQHQDPAQHGGDQGPGGGCVTIQLHPTQGWLTITNSTPGHSGNYSCVPSYTTPDWVTVHVIRGQNQEEGGLGR